MTSKSKELLKLEKRELMKAKVKIEPHGVSSIVEIWMESQATELTIEELHAKKQMLHEENLKNPENKFIITTSKGLVNLLTLSESQVQKVLVEFQVKYSKLWNIIADSMPEIEQETSFQICKIFVECQQTILRCEVLQRFFESTKVEVSSKFKSQTVIGNLEEVKSELIEVILRREKLVERMISQFKKFLEIIEPTSINNSTTECSEISSVIRGANMDQSSTVKIPEMSHDEIQQVMIAENNSEELNKNEKLDIRTVVSTEAVKSSKITTSQSFKDESLVINENRNCREVFEDKTKYNSKSETENLSDLNCDKGKSICEEEGFDWRDILWNDSNDEKKIPQQVSKINKPSKRQRCAQNKKLRKNKKISQETDVLKSTRIISSENVLDKDSERESCSTEIKDEKIEFEKTKLQKVQENIQSSGSEKSKLQLVRENGTTKVISQTFIEEDFQFVQKLSKRKRWQFKRQPREVFGQTVSETLRANEFQPLRKNHHLVISTSTKTSSDERIMLENSPEISTVQTGERNQRLKKNILITKIDRDMKHEKIQLSSGNEKETEKTCFEDFIIQDRKNSREKEQNNSIIQTKINQRSESLDISNKYLKSMTHQEESATSSGDSEMFVERTEELNFTRAEKILMSSSRKNSWEDNKVPEEEINTEKLFVSKPEEINVRQIQTNSETQFANIFEEVDTMKSSETSCRVNFVGGPVLQKDEICDKVSPYKSSSESLKVLERVGEKVVLVMQSTTNLFLVDENENLKKGFEKTKSVKSDGTKVSLVSIKQPSDEPQPSTSKQAQEEEALEKIKSPKKNERSSQDSEKKLISKSGSKTIREESCIVLSECPVVSELQKSMMSQIELGETFVKTVEDCSSGSQTKSEKRLMDDSFAEADSERVNICENKFYDDKLCDGRISFENSETFLNTCQSSLGGLEVKETSLININIDSVSSEVQKDHLSQDFVNKEIKETMAQHFEEDLNFVSKNSSTGLDFQFFDELKVAKNLRTIGNKFINTNCETKKQVENIVSFLIMKIDEQEKILVISIGTTSVNSEMLPLDASKILNPCPEGVLKDPDKTFGVSFLLSLMSSISFRNFIITVSKSGGTSKSYQTKSGLTSIESQSHHSSKSLVIQSNDINTETDLLEKNSDQFSSKLSVQNFSRREDILKIFSSSYKTEIVWSSYIVIKFEDTPIELIPTHLKNITTTNSGMKKSVPSRHKEEPKKVSEKFENTLGLSNIHEKLGKIVVLEQSTTGFFSVDELEETCWRYRHSVTFSADKIFGVLTDGNDACVFIVYGTLGLFRILQRPGQLEDQTVATLSLECFCVGKQEKKSKKILIALEVMTKIVGLFNNDFHSFSRIFKLIQKATYEDHTELFHVSPPRNLFPRIQMSSNAMPSESVLFKNRLQNNKPLFSLSSVNKRSVQPAFMSVQQMTRLLDCQISSSSNERKDWVKQDVKKLLSTNNNFLSESNFSRHSEFDYDFHRFSRAFKQIRKATKAIYEDHNELIYLSLPRDSLSGYQAPSYAMSPESSIFGNRVPKRDPLFSPTLIEKRSIQPPVMSVRQMAELLEPKDDSSISFQERWIQKGTQGPRGVNNNIQFSLPQQSQLKSSHFLHSLRTLQNLRKQRHKLFSNLRQIKCLETAYLIAQTLVGRLDLVEYLDLVEHLDLVVRLESLESLGDTWI